MPLPFYELTVVLLRKLDPPFGDTYVVSRLPWVLYVNRDTVIVFPFCTVVTWHGLLFTVVETAAHVVPFQLP